MPKISVVMTAYNSEKYIKDAIDSVLNQSFEDFEFIIVDDGSQDNTVSIIKSYDDSRIKLLINEQNQGICYSSNRGIEATTGDYIARIDSDDICRADRFQIQVDFLDQNPDVFICASNLRLFDDKGHIEESDWGFYDSKYIGMEFLLRNRIGHSTTMFRGEEYREAGYVYEKYIQAHDYYIWTRAIADGKKIQILPYFLVDYRLNDMGITSRNTAEKNLIEHIDIRHRYVESMVDDVEIKKILHSIVNRDNVFSFKERCIALEYWRNIFVDASDTLSDELLQGLVWEMISCGKHKAIDETFSYIYSKYRKYSIFSKEILWLLKQSIIG